MKLADMLREQDGLTAARGGTTFCGTRGEYTFLLLTGKTNELILSVLRGGEDPEKESFREFIKARPELSGCKTAGPRVTFTLRPGATAKSGAEKIHTLLPELLSYLHENGYENCCEISRAVGATVGCMTNGVPQLLAPDLSAVGIAVSIVVMLLAVYLGNRVDIAIAAVQELDLTFGQAFAWMHELVDADAYMENLVTLYLFSALGAVPAALNAHKVAREQGLVYRIGE